MKNVNARRHTKGETLVEVIVSFTIVLLTLTTITAVVQLGIRLNNRAMAKSEALETASAAIEGGSYGTLSDASAKFTLTHGEESESFSQDVTVYTGADLDWFKPRRTN